MKGKVTLVGAGCGKGLITLMGLEAIRHAEVIIYDDLIDDEILNEAPSECELVYAGKRKGKHSKKQDEINEILLSYAMKGKRVVRLKGGDSFVFGRGGEEAAYLKENGIECDVIPGVTSSVAVPGHFGIPVTHRGVAQSFTVVTGHSASGEEENYEALAALKGTLVFLMGHGSAGDIARKLMENGKNPETKVSVLSKGFSDEEKRADGVLKNMGTLALTVETPAILVVGNVAGLDLVSPYEFNEGTGSDLVSPNEYKSCDLRGVSVTVAGTKSFTQRAADLLKSQGAFVKTCNPIKVFADEASIPQELDDFTWFVFTSVNGVKIFFDQFEKNKNDIRKLSSVKFACIGDGTSEELRKHGIYADLIPEHYTVACLGETLVKNLSNKDRVLILRANNGSPELDRCLNEAGITYVDAKIYATEKNSAYKKRVIESDYMVFASAFGAKCFFESGSEISDKTRIVCIGEITAEEVACHVEGRDILTAKKHDLDGIVKVIKDDVKMSR